MNACRSTLLLLSLCLLPHLPFMHAEPIRVRSTQGQGRGFVVVRSASGAVIGNGEYSQFSTGDRVTSRLTLHLRDGSVDDDITVYSQHGSFALISDHHVQRGPFFSSPSDATITAAGDVTIKTVDKDGKEKVETNHLDVPADLSNGLTSVLLANVPANAPEFQLGMFAPSGKGRLLRVRVAPEARSSFSIVGLRHPVAVFRLHPELGGVAAVVAPAIGKQPADALIYILEGECPAIVREVGQLEAGGPIVSIELAGTIFAPFTAPGK